MAIKKTRYITAALFLTFILVNGSWSQVERREQGTLIIEGIPEIPQRIVDRMFQYQSSRSAFIEDWDQTGKGMLISTDFGETIQLHYVEKPGGARKQVTFFSDPIADAAMCPDPITHGFLFLKDIEGKGNYQIFYYNLDNGEYKMLTDGLSRNAGMRWSNKGDKFVYYSTRRTGRDWDLYLSDLDNPHEAKPILQEGGVWFAVDWSPDDKQLIVCQYISASESYYYVLDIASSKLTQINPSDEKIAYRAALWSKDEKGIFIVSDEGREFQHLRYYDQGERACTDLTAKIPWDIKEITISPQRDKLAFTVNEGGIGKLYLLDIITKKYKQVPGIPVGRIDGLLFHPDGSQLAFVVNTVKTPGDIYVLNLMDNSLERWTFSEVGGLDTDSFVVPELIHYETFDKYNGKPRMIPAFYYKPRKGKTPYPVMIYIHGGPMVQATPCFDSELQYILNELGVAVLFPNVRGSSGYGKTYLKLDDGYQREDAVKDIGKLLDWIEGRPELDASRVGVCGGSYGGYMVLASMSHYNNRLKCGIDMCGIGNFVTFLENTAESGRSYRREEYGDERDPKMQEFLIKISPTTNAHRITKPMFIAQGLNDPRVPASESDQIVSAIRKNGGVVWYLIPRFNRIGVKLGVFGSPRSLTFETI